MNIAIVLISYGIGGTEKRFPNLLRYLKANSNNNYHLIINGRLVELLKKIDHFGALSDITVKVPQENNLLARYCESTDDICRVRNLNRVYRKITKPIKNALKNHYYNLEDSDVYKKMDVVHLTTPPYGNFNLFPSNVPLLLEGQDSTLRSFYYPYKIDLLSRKNAFINFASTRIFKGFQQIFPHFDEKKMFDSPCSFIDYSQTRIDAKRKIVTFVGNLKDTKNPILFLKSAERVLNYRKDVVFYMCGRGGLKSYIDSYINKHKLNTQIECGFCERPIDILAQSLIYTSLQKYDNYHSQALMEAMACGCAIVASNVGETSRLVSEKEGVLVDFSIESISEKIISLLDNVEQAKLMGENARKKVMKEQTVERYAHYLEDVYSRMVSR